MFRVARSTPSLPMIGNLNKCSGSFAEFEENKTVQRSWVGKRAPSELANAAALQLTTLKWQIGRGVVKSQDEKAHIWPFHLRTDIKHGTLPLNQASNLCVFS